MWNPLAQNPAVEPLERLRTFWGSNASLERLENLREINQVVSAQIGRRRIKLISDCVLTKSHTHFPSTMSFSFSGFCHDVMFFFHEKLKPCE